MRRPGWLRLRRTGDVKPGERAATRRERQDAEERYAHDRDHVIVPLREMRERNHISDDISALIRRRARREAGES